MAPVAVDPIAAPSAGKKLPVTLLSGFLGAGKTTLLEHILTADHGCGRIAVIVNDMASLNVDAALLTTHNVKQKEQRVVEMQNGCICCTLRGDLLEEVADLAASGKVDYLVIESTGISEPMQVAETFSEEFADMHAQAAADLHEEAKTDPESARLNKRVAEILEAGGLTAVSRLDTCVTMVDALNVFANFDTAEFLKDRSGEPVPEEDDRAISDLMVDQLEFANVVVINKVDLVSPSDVERIRGLVKTLNPEAKILTSSRAKVDLKEVLNTGMFNYTKAAMSAGWLKSLNEEIKPETEEYGVGSFVYRARKPFHPERLWNTVKEVFVIAQAEFIDDGEESEDGESDDAASDDEMSSPDDDDDDAQLNPTARLDSKKASPTWAGLLRSKGFFWLATRSLLYGEWSSAGVMLSLMGGQRWRCEVPEAEWGDNPEVVNAIRRDFEGEWGDRRQEIVFIGTGMRSGGEALLRSALDKCLLTDDEMAQWEGIMRSKAKKLRSYEQKDAALHELFPDGFEDWEDPEAEVDEEEEEEDDKMNGKGKSHKGHRH